jgi:hypothetical protein
MSLDVSLCLIILEMQCISNVSCNLLQVHAVHSRLCASSAAVRTFHWLIGVTLYSFKTLPKNLRLSLSRHVVVRFIL